VTRSRALLLLGFLLALAVVLLLYGVIPGSSSSNHDFFSESHARCVGESMGPGRPWCQSLGIPFGAPLFTEGPVLTVAGVVGRVLGYALAYDLVVALVLLGALVGTYALLRVLGASRWLSLVTATVYLLCPTVIGMDSFPGTAEGFQLLPTLALADLLAMRELERRSGWAMVVVFAAYAAVRSLTLFLDGYAFFASALVGLALWIAWAWRTADVSRGRKLFGAAVYVGGGVVAALLYTAYAPDVFEPPSLEVFRSLGLDVATLVVPSERLQLGSLLGLGMPHARLWGDGSNALYNYVGPVVLGLAVVGLVRHRSDGRVAALAVAAVVALVLSLGPSLKVAQEAPRGAGEEARYLAPAQVGVALPWGGLYESIPGIDSMRASYRWFGVTRMALIVLAALGVAVLLRSRRFRLLGVALGVVALLETAPQVGGLVEGHASFGERRELVRRDLIAPLRAVTRPGERVFYLQPEGTTNQFLSDYVTVESGLRSYNVGGDKNGVAAQREWPPEIQSLARPGDRREAVVAALRSGQTEAVVIPLFNLAGYSYEWPPPDSSRPRVKQAFTALLADRRLSVERRHWFVVLRLRRPGRQPERGRPTGPAPRP
jgi:hypothetical protein